MRIRRTSEYEIQCHGCGSLLRYRFDELRFKGLMDQRIPCPACGWGNLVVQGGHIAEGMVPKILDKEWRTDAVRTD